METGQVQKDMWMLIQVGAILLGSLLGVLLAQYMIYYRNKVEKIERFYMYIHLLDLFVDQGVKYEHDFGLPLTIQEIRREMLRIYASEPWYFDESLERQLYVVLESSERIEEWEGRRDTSLDKSEMNEQVYGESFDMIRNAIIYFSEGRSRPSTFEVFLNFLGKKAPISDRTDNIDHPERI